MMVVRVARLAQPRTISLMQPIRKRRDFWTERRLVSSGTIVFCSLLAFTATAFPEQWLSERARISAGCRGGAKND